MTPARHRPILAGRVADHHMLDSARVAFRQHAEVLAARIRQRFGIVPLVQESIVRLEREQGHRFAADVMEAFPGEIRSVNISRPTLEDVFVRRTGHRFWTEPDAQ